MYVLCLSVIASVIPKSKKRTLAPNFAPSMLLAIPPIPVFPESVLQLYLKVSSDLLILNVPGTFPLHEPLLFVNVQLPSVPSLKDKATGTFGSFTIVAHDVKKKIEIDHYWNKLIFEKYKNQIDIDKNTIIEKIAKRKLIKDKKIYELSEIIFEKDQNVSLKDKVDSISESINEIGFKNTANLYSIADTNKYGGSIGWVDEISLSDKISKILSKTNLGDYTETIKIGANFLILKVDNIKFEKSEIDEEKEFNKIYNFEIDKKLEQFSKIYFNKVKINTKIHEL